jgi:hypothetical protein
VAKIRRGIQNYELWRKCGKIAAKLRRKCGAIIPPQSGFTGKLGNQENDSMEILLKLPTEFTKRFNLMLELSGISLPQDLINEALTLFEWALSRVILGEQIGSLDEKENKWKAINMESLSYAAEKSRDFKINRIF